MDGIVQHRELFERWSEMPLPLQMANIGSEVSRSLKNRNKPAKFQGAFERALELFDFTIEVAVNKKQFARVKEICRAREEYCDYFLGNSMGTDAVKMMKYYDQFVMLGK